MNDIFVSVKKIRFKVKTVDFVPSMSEIQVDSPVELVSRTFVKLFGVYLFDIDFSFLTTLYSVF